MPPVFSPGFYFPLVAKSISTPSRNPRSLTSTADILSVSMIVRMMIAAAAMTSSLPYPFKSRAASEILRASALLVEAFRETATWECRACAGG